MSHEGRPEPYCNYMDNSDHITSPKANIYRQTVQEVKKIAPKLLFLAQLNHSGRQLTKIQKLRNHSLNVFSEHPS